MMQNKHWLKDNRKNDKAQRKRARKNEGTSLKLIQEVSIISVFMEQYQEEVLMPSQVSLLKLPSILLTRQ